MFPFYIPLETIENSKFWGVFREYKMGTLGRNELTVVVSLLFMVKLLPIHLLVQIQQ